ncbi:MAG TPA: GAF and ANTAR domain-containing protein [Mycobacteriales bacterium]|jgi:transcriptional regulator with GAF, ATPase, and Fis domain|nr:GAF and ANTAR domain-containing protein [Mycobacteriales bacterium]
MKRGATMLAREQQLTKAFVQLADTLVSDYDVTDLLHGLSEHCVDLLQASSAGLLLTDNRGNLQLLASSTEATRLLELFQLQTDEGPCLDCFRTGKPVEVPDLAAAVDRWPRFTPAALDNGYAAVHALPLRLRTETIGALNLFGATTGSIPADDLRVAQALADVATIGILQERAIHHSEIIIEQLQGALNSRIIIEQAKGVLAQQANIDMDEAFRRLRSQSRKTNTRLTMVARDLIEGTLDASAIATDPLRDSRS